MYACSALNTSNCVQGCMSKVIIQTKLRSLAHFARSKRTPLYVHLRSTIERFVYRTTNMSLRICMVVFPMNWTILHRSYKLIKPLNITACIRTILFGQMIILHQSELQTMFSFNYQNYSGKYFATTEGGFCGCESWSWPNGRRVRRKMLMIQSIETFR